MWRMRVVLAAVLGLWAGRAGSEGAVQLAPLHVIPTENQSSSPLPPESPARVRLRSPDPGRLAQVLGVELARPESSFEYVIGSYPQLRSGVDRTWLESTFVIDFTEPAFDTLREQLDSIEGTLTRAKLVEFVAGYIEESAGRGWDLASVVARGRKGDCSEHAVLTAALARLRGMPARVTIGMALLSDGTEHGAFGHAWAEILEGGTWVVADAALWGTEATVRYVPIGLFENEGMGYALELMRLSQMWIDRVIVLGPG